MKYLRLLLASIGLLLVTVTPVSANYSMFFSYGNGGNMGGFGYGMPMYSDMFSPFGNTWSPWATQPMNQFNGFGGFNQPFGGQPFLPSPYIPYSPAYSFQGNMGYPFGGLNNFGSFGNLGNFGNSGFYNGGNYRNDTSCRIDCRVNQPYTSPWSNGNYGGYNNGFGGSGLDSFDGTFSTGGRCYRIEIDRIPCSSL